MESPTLQQPQPKPTPDPPTMVNGTSTDARPFLDPGSVCEVLTIHKKFDKTLQQLVELPVNEAPDDAKRKQLEHALVVKRILKKKTGDVDSIKLQINSPHILNALQRVVKYFPEEPSLFDRKIKTTSPYPILYHYWDDLDALRNIADGEERMHLDLLMDFLEREIGEDRSQACKMVENGFISFCLLWTIFKPGALILHSEQGHQQVFRLEGATYGKNAKTCEKYLRLQLIYTDFDGVSFGRASKTVDVCQSELKQPSAITSLSYFPLQYRKADGLLERLEERGKRFLQISSVQLRRYDGIMLAIPEKDVKSEQKFSPKPVHGRIILDTKTFNEENTKYQPKMSDDQNPRDTTPPCTVPFWDAIEPSLCPPTVAGYYPSLKTWGRFFIDHITDLEWMPDALDALILPDAPKKVISSLVSSHKFPERTVDQQELKGKGLVCLLHGTPGSGKTLTAELVAEHTKRALIVITSGELGTDVAEINANLRRFLQYATTWNAVVLIDEADVFLEARQEGAINRMEQNGLVAVFLRHLEYFQGIVFLTSNRFQGFDPAIKSRIHISLKYGSPDFKTRTLLWKQMLSRIPAEEINFDMEAAVKMAANAKMNGREISNSVNTLRTLSREDRKKMGMEHFEMIMQVWVAFEGEKGTEKLPGHGAGGYDWILSHRALVILFCVGMVVAMKTSSAFM
ncbi:P-loop containing nucleoside triphosphate hydrolase protein [Wilcoxina mikolae CBS 423.85]|nr:P-loop containing nucleoside triphosphate hydrolase protein [Wilcoxina mikolae CBS 423.85]